jgi:hypothetical protein
MNQIKDDHDFMVIAMKSYDNPSCITIDEFNKDLYTITLIKKYIRKFNSGDQINIRKLVNYSVIFYNCFGNSATDLLLYKLSDKEFLSVMIPIMVYLGRETINIPREDINTAIIQELLEL